MNADFNSATRIYGPGSCGSCGGLAAFRLEDFAVHGSERVRLGQRPTPSGHPRQAGVEHSLGELLRGQRGSLAGLRTVVQPASIAGATFRVAITGGKFRCVMRKHVAQGLCWTRIYPDRSIGALSSDGFRLPASSRVV